MDVHSEILRMKTAGYSIADVYIYVKDYISLDDCVSVYESL
jgi:hypothetical protein